MPLGTVVREVYEDAERSEVQRSLADLIRGNSWHTAGVYCFWDPEQLEPLYIGLASNLPARFSQHNGLNGNRPRSGNKGREINEWFLSNKRIGYSLVLQEGLADESVEPYSRNGEGQLLEGYRRVHGKLPPWNLIGGSRLGAGFVRNNSAIWVDLMTGRYDNLLVARRTLRGLNEDPTAEYYEVNIHMARTAFSLYESANDENIISAMNFNMNNIPPYARLIEIGDLNTYLSEPAPHPEIQQPG